MRVTAETKFAVLPEWLLYADIGDAAVRLYAVLARHADREGRSHPSRGRLAELMRCSTKTVDRALKDLVAVGAVEVEKRFLNGSPTTNRFHLRTSDPATPVSLPLDTTGGSDTSDEGVGTQVSHGTKAIERKGVPTTTTPPTSVLPTLAPTARRSDGLYEVLFALETGLPYSKENRRTLTRTAAEAIEPALAEIRATGIGPEELAAAIAAWPRVMGPATCTANAVKKHLPRLRAAANGFVARRETSDLEDTLAQVRRMRLA